MKMRKFRVTVLMLFFILLFLQNGYAQAGQDAKLYSQAIRSVQSGTTDFAFLQFYKLANSYPESKFLENALFSIGEYYFSTNNYSAAFQIFNKFIKKYPQSKAKFPALAYLLKISNKEQNEALVKELEQKIKAEKRTIFLFGDCKEYTYKSSFSKIYRVLCFIDKMEFYVDGQLFMEILY